LVVGIIPLYFVANAIQPTIGPSLETQGDQYFSFLLVGIIAYGFLGPALSAVPGAIGGGIRSGTLEAYFSTPVRLPVLLAGLSAYTLLWTLLRTVLLVAVGAAFGAEFSWGGLPSGALILTLIVLAHLPFGLISAAFVLAFRTGGPLNRGVMAVSALLGGVYYPTKVIPSWIQEISAFLPLTYGLRALRRTVLEGWSMTAVASDVLILCVMAAVLLAIGFWVFNYALAYAKRAGTLAQY
jgi:ABC-2 type transport system permease protein